jgi:hypothetical protein
MREGALYRNRQTLLGSAFAVSHDTIITAAHVLRGVNLREVVYAPYDGERIKVEAIGLSDSKDLAALRLATPVHEYFSVGVPVDGARWRVSKGPLPTDPLLTGVIENAEQRYKLGTALQLRVEQTLLHYKGYSGSAVRADLDQYVAIGVLVEQEPFRRRAALTPGQPDQASNVLWALHIHEAIVELGLTSVVTRFNPELAWRSAASGAIRSVLAANKEFEAKIASRKRRDVEQVMMVRAALNTLLIGLKTGSGHSAADYLDRARNNLLELAGLDISGHTGRVSNRKLLSISYFTLYWIAALQEQNELAHYYCLKLYITDPHLARTQYLPQFFRRTLSCRCSDLYDEYSSAAEKVAQQTVFPREIAQSGAGAAATGAGAVAALAAAIKFRPTMVLVSPLLQQTAEYAKNATNPEIMRAAAIERLRRHYSKKIDLRCAEICAKELEAQSETSDHIGKLEPCIDIPMNVDTLGL